MATKDQFRRLLEGWVKFLKLAQMVDQKSNPDGTLRYRIKPTLDHVRSYLTSETQYSEDQIEDAIATVKTKKGIVNEPAKLQNNPTPEKPPGTPAGQPPGTNVSTWMHHEMRPGERPEEEPPEEPKRQIGSNKPEPGPRRIQHDPNSVTDIEYRDVPNKPKSDPNDINIDPDERRDRNKAKKKKFGFWESLEEEITDTTPEPVDEKDVEQIFKILSGGKEISKGQAAIDNLNTWGEEKQEKSEQLRKVEVGRIITTIKNSMTDSQRRSLWRVLKDGKIK